MEQKIEVPKAETLEELGTQLGQLRYDALMVVLSSLRDEIARQYVQDTVRSRFVLAATAGFLVEDLRAAVKGVSKMLEISRPSMAEDLKNRPLR